VAEDAKAAKLVLQKELMENTKWNRKSHYGQGQKSGHVIYETLCYLFAPNKWSTTPIF